MTHAAPPRALALGLLWLWLASTPAQAAPPISDAERLNAPVPAEFERPQVIIYPLLDQRPLATGGGAVSPAPAWAQLIASLSARANLKVRSPDGSVEAIRRRAGYARALRLARTTARRGTEDYQRARLERAARDLGAAVDAMRELEHDVVDPDEVGRLILLRGQALLEAGDRDGALRSFRAALTIQPGLRLVPGTDSPAAVAALDAVRSELAADPPLPQTFRLVPARLKSDRHILRARIVGDTLEVSLQSVGGLRVERQALSAPDAGDRLASRVWACLPFGRTPIKRRHHRRWLVDAGFNYTAFVNSSVVDLFSNVGVGVNASLLAAPHLTLDANVALTNSNRDPNEDLREDISTVRVFAGPGFTWTAGPFRAGANAGFDLATLSDVVTTRNAACKHFSAADAHPLCNHERDINRSGRAWRAGPALALSAAVHLVDDIYLTLRVRGGLLLYESVDNGLGPPLTSQLNLGYAFD